MNGIKVNATNTVYASIASVYRAFVNGEIEIDGIERTEPYMNFYYYVKVNPEKFTYIEKSGIKSEQPSNVEQSIDDNDEENVACYAATINPITNVKMNIHTDPDKIVDKAWATIGFINPDKHESICRFFSSKRTTEVPIVVEYRDEIMLFPSITAYVTWFFFMENTKVQSFIYAINKSCVSGTPVKNNGKKKVGYTNVKFSYLADKSIDFDNKVYKQMKSAGYDNYMEYLFEVVAPRFLRKHIKYEGLKFKKVSYPDMVEGYLANANIVYMRKYGVYSTDITTSVDNTNHMFRFFNRKKITPIATTTSSSTTSTVPSVPSIPTPGVESTINKVITYVDSLSSDSLTLLGEFFKSVAKDKEKVEGK